jgi:hypothetical protein
MTGGFYCMHRGWMDHPVFASASYTDREAWLHLIETAAFVTSRIRRSGHMSTIARGQVATSYRALANSLGWSVNRVVRYLRLLSEEKMILCDTATGHLLITICNYDAYQIPLSNSNTAEDTSMDTPPNTLTETATNTNIRKALPGF